VRVGKTERYAFFCIGVGASRKWTKPSVSSMKLLEYFDAIDDKDGKANWMTFFRIGGNTANTNRWLAYMKDRDLVSEFVELENGKEKTYYRKTESGNILHNMLKNYDLVGIITKELPKRKLRRAF
jgi:hypothetical protein